MKLLKSRKNLIYAGMIAVLATILAVSSTYAWLGVSRVPYVSDVGVSVIVDNALLIAPDINGKPGEWGNNLDASEFLSGMVPLKPVTYTPEGFKRLLYDDTGRTNNVELIDESNINVKYNGATSKAEMEALEAKGYMVRLDFWMKCEGATAAVYLSEAVETADGQMGGGTYVVGAPVWNAKKLGHTNGGHGSETTIRMGLKMIPSDMDCNLRTGQQKFIMYEPNCNIHYDGSTGYIATPSVNGGNLIDDAHLITQDASSWKEQDPVLQGVVMYQAGKFNKKTTLFELDTDSMMKVSLYVWMEGQDYDCIAATVADAISISANIQFGVSAESKSTGIKRGNAIDPDRDYEVKRF